jgi:Lipid A 3-O-deacylase (PagL)
VTPLPRFSSCTSSAFLLIVAMLLCVAPAARCQTHPAQPANFQVGDNEFGIWASYAPQAPHVIGITSPRQFGELGFRYARRIYEHPGSGWSLEWTMDVMPVAIMLQPKILGSFINQQGNTVYITGPREAVYGGGVNPLGLKLNGFRTHRLQLYGASTAGFVSSLRPVPVDIKGETQFNFDFDFHFGFQLFNSARTHAWTFGYKYLHISNAERGQINPGVDLQGVFVGYTFFK